MSRRAFFFGLPDTCLLKTTQEELMEFQRNHFVISFMVNHGGNFKNQSECLAAAESAWDLLDTKGYLEGMKKDMLAEVFDHAQSHEEQHESILSTILGSRFGQGAAFTEDVDSEVVDDATVQKAVKAKRLTNNKKKYDA